MRLPLVRRPLALGLGLALAWYGSAAARPPRLTDLRALKSPASPGSAGPSLSVASDGAVWMSWYERRDSTHLALRVSRFVKKVWGEAITVAEGDSFAVNWANVPALVALGGGNLMMAWSWKSGGDPNACDVRISGSKDGGQSWTPPIVPHRDRTATEHGFVSLVPAEGGGARAFWLDGRKFANRSPNAPPDRHADETALRTAWIGMDGALSDESQVDDRACDCCPTAAVGHGSRALVAYRDRRGDEVRDISVAWLAAGGWSEPAPVDPDGWRIEGCPVNGPAIDRCKERLALAWFTMARDTARVKLAFSDDAGLEFGPAVRVDAGDPLGRVGVVLLEDGSALVSWLEVRGPGGLFQVRAIGRKGELGKVTTVAQTSAARASGVPRMARKGYRVLFAWTEASDPSQIRVAIARIAH